MNRELLCFNKELLVSFCFFVCLILFVFYFLFLAPLCGMWILVPRPGTEPTLTTLKAQVLTTGLLGKSL